LGARAKLNLKGLGIGGVWDCSTPRFLAKQFQLYALYSRKNGGAVRAPKEVLHKLQFFMELLHGGVRGAVSNTPIISTHDRKLEVTN
jgi:hypothetical protein